jgi:proteasome component ECM29
LSEVIVGRDWVVLGGGGPVLNDDDLFEGGVVSAGIRLVRIWNVASRALDDVQGAVRDVGETLARAARSLTIRLCSLSVDQKYGNVEQGQHDQIQVERDAAAAAGTSIWWLMCKGLHHTCPEVTGASLSTLVEVVGVVRPTILEPSLPTLLNSLLLAVSALEPAALNYMQLRTTDQEGLERTRLQLAQIGPLALAVTKCLELIPRTKWETQQSIAPALDAALRQSAGFATRAATADAVSTLCTICPAVFRFTGTANTNPSVRLLRAFYFASERERGIAAKDKMIHALGNLAAICPASSVRSLAVRACERYRHSTGNNFDPSSRRAAAAALRTIAVRAPNVFSDGGRADVWCTRVLPVAYIGRKDSDSKIASMWQDVWDEGGSVANISESSSSTNNFGTRLEEKLLHWLVKECVSSLQDVSWSSRVAGASALQELCEIGILSPVPRISQMSRRDEAAALLRTQNRASACQLAIRQCVEILIKPRLWNGKADVLKAAALLSSKWLDTNVCDDQEIINDNSLMEFVQLHQWWPVIISQGRYDNDFCINDGWFVNRKVEDDPYIGESDGSVLETKHEDVSKDEHSTINFQLCDDIVEVDEVEEIATTIYDDKVVLLDGVVTFMGLCRFLIEQAIPSSLYNKSTADMDALLIYKTTALRCFRDLLSSLPSSPKSRRMKLYKLLSPLLLAMINQSLVDKDIEKRSPPVLTAGAINCIEVLLWDTVGKDDDVDVNKLITIIKNVGGRLQPAWTVREATAQCIAQLTRFCSDTTIQQHVTVAEVVDSARQAMTDSKFWKVRYVILIVKIP